MAYQDYTTVPERCDDVTSSFQDPSTGIWHQCYMLCDYVQPELSNIDCQGYCPELYTCLMLTSQIISTIWPIRGSARSHMPSVGSMKSAQSIQNEADVSMVTTNIFLLSVVIGAVVLISGVSIFAVIICRNRRLTNERPEPSREPFLVENGRIYKGMEPGCSPTKPTSIVSPDQYQTRPIMHRDLSETRPIVQRGLDDDGPKTMLTTHQCCMGPKRSSSLPAIPVN